MTGLGQSLSGPTAVRQIGDPVLRMKAQPVQAFDSTLRELESTMFEVMRLQDGVGLAAPQIGVSLAFFVMDCDSIRTSIANPVLEIIESGLIVESEGCLSVLGKRQQRGRYAAVRVTGQGIDGNAIDVVASDLGARCLQHEYDHLQGRLYCDPVRN